MSKAIRAHRIVDQITTKTDKRFEPVAHMADTIVEMTLKTGFCSQQDLIAIGYTHQEITLLWHFSNALASIELKCRANGIGTSFERETRYA
jgi:hypothetical protein